MGKVLNSTQFDFIFASTHLTPSPSAQPPGRISKIGLISVTFGHAPMHTGEESDAHLDSYTISAEPGRSLTPASRPARMSSLPGLVVWDLESRFVMV
jgi:hypothetical protein